jgi:RNA polymerase sigma factor (sigma-70 family)
MGSWSGFAAAPVVALLVWGYARARAGRELKWSNRAILIETSDSEIVRSSWDQPAVFAEVYDRHASAVYRYAARRAGIDAADDMMAETFLVSFERRMRFDETYVSALPWLLGIATVLIRKHRGAEARFLRAVAASGPPATVVDDQDDRLDASLTVRGLAGASRRMPARDRDALLLYAWGDLDYEGVALALDIPVGTVRSRLNRARRVLRQSAGTSTAEEVELRGEPSSSRPRTGSASRA